MLPVGAELTSSGFESSRPRGHVVAQESFLPGSIVRGLHPRSVAPKEAVALRRVIGRGNDDERKLNLVVVGHSRFSGDFCHFRIIVQIGDIRTLNGGLPCPSIQDTAKP